MLRFKVIFNSFSIIIFGIMLAGNSSVSQAGCGCSFTENLAKNTQKPFEDGFFWSNMDYTKAKIIMGGKYVNLKLLSSKESKKEIKGAKSIQIYKTFTGNTGVSIEKTVTNVCKKNDMECEAVGYDAAIMVNDGNRIRKFKTSGDCGC